MEEWIRRMPEKALDIAVFILFAVFTVCPLVNFLLVCVLGIPDFSYGVYMRNPVWYYCNNTTLCAGAAIVMLYWLKAYLRNAAPKLQKHPSVIFFLAFNLWMAVMTCVNGLSENALLGVLNRNEGTLTYLSYMLYFLLAAMWKDEKLKKAWLWVFAGSAAVLEGCLIADRLFLGGGLHTMESGAVFYNYNHFGYYILMSALVCTAGSVFAEKRGTRILSLLLTCVAAEALIVVDTLGVQIAYLFGLLLTAAVCILTKRCPVRRVLPPVAAAAAVVVLNKALPAASAAGAILDKNVNTAIGQVQAVTDGLENAPDTLGSNRLGLWRWTVARIRERPILGYGNDALIEEMYAATKGNRCHCEYLHYALSYGIPAAVLYVCGVFSVYLRGLRRRRTLTAVNLIGLCAAFGYMVSAAVGVSKWYTAPFAFILLGLGYGKGKALDRSGEKR